ncbi:hypothetical protein LNT71_004091 [Salmonella enterica]|nr:hypothetical protein [Salmonella enterica]
MSKIAKLIRSALNNSSANEAAQALKMAAATMQKEGVNPSDLLQEKGANGDDSAALAKALKALDDASDRYIKLHSEKCELERQLKALKTDGGSTAYGLLKTRYEELAKTTEATRTELREAKEVAIKWHKVAQSQEEELRDLAIASVKNAELEKQHYNRAVEWKNRFIWGAVFACCAVVIAWAGGSTANDPAPVQMDKATCYINIKGQETNKVSYNAGAITSTQGKQVETWQHVEGINTLSSFINDINYRVPGKVYCNLGVIE